ncbi:MAG: choice-of-anchor D domain-containing protein [Halioglobus sp.]
MTYISKILNLNLLLAALATFVSVSSYASPFTTDQQNDELPTTGGYSSFSLLIGQSFIPTFNSLDHVELQVNAQQTTESTTVHVEIRESPTGLMLGSSNPITMTGTTIQLRHFEFSPIDISAYSSNSSSLFIAVVRDSGGSFAVFHAGSYTNGEAYTSFGGGGFQPSVDLWFRTGTSSVSNPAPEITVTDSVASATDLQIPFGNVTEMNSSDSTVTVTNDGDQPLTIGQIAFNDPLAAPFSIPNDNCSLQVVAPAANCSLTVRFAPPSTGASTDSFDIPSDDADENPVTISVSGTGISAAAPEITVTDSVNPFNDLQVPFGEITEMTSSDQTVTVTNDGTAILDIGPIGSLLAPFGFLNDTCSNQSLLPAANCSLTVRFTPPSTGASNDSFAIPSNDDDENPVMVIVSGTGTATPPPDSNGDGISDADAIALGLDPNDPDGDTDNDGISDVDEVGDVSSPMDNDGDGVIDALEPGVDASDAEVASGVPLESGDSVTIETETGEMLADISTDPVIAGPSGISFPFGMVSYTTSVPNPGDFVTVRLVFSADLPTPLELHKVEGAVFTVLPTATTDPDGYWTQIDARTVDITLKDGGAFDLDHTVNGVVVDPIAPGSGDTGGKVGVCRGLDPVTSLFSICLQAHSAKNRVEHLQSKGASPKAVNKAQSALDKAIVKFAELGGGSIPGL